MAGPTFEGELESLTPSQIELVSEVIQKRGFKTNKVVIETLGQAGDNYSAKVKKITAVFENGETFKMVAKVATTNEMLRLSLSTAILFQNEFAMYNEILPKFVELQHAAGLAPEESFRFPKCYGTITEPLNEIVLLEDLKESNYEMLDRFKTLTNESVKEVLKQFAKLHSLSFALKKQEPETFDSYDGKLQDFLTIYCDNPEFRVFLSDVETDMFSILDDEVYKRCVRNSISQLPEQTARTFKHERDLRYSVVTHGDSWINNFMFRIKDGVPKDVMLIDYQISKVASPVCDLLYVIFSSTDYSTRHQHFYEWINFYYSELDKCLSKFGLKADEEFPRDQVDADLRRYSKVFFSSSILLFTVLTRKSEHAAKLKEAMESNIELQEVSAAMQESTLDPESAALFKKKVEDLVDSYRELGYMD